MNKAGFVKLRPFKLDSKASLGTESNFGFAFCIRQSIMLEKLQ